jgi:hypothetical protein
MRFVLDNDGVWKRESPKIDNDGNECFEYTFITITQVPVNDLLAAWEDLVMELSEKEIKLYNLKEAYLIAEQKIINEVDFKALYGANNQKVRDNHVKSELADMVSDMKALEFGIGWIRQYIPLLKEVIRSKQC